MLKKRFFFNYFHYFTPIKMDEEGAGILFQNLYWYMKFKRQAYLWTTPTSENKDLPDSPLSSRHSLS